MNVLEILRSPRFYLLALISYVLVGATYWHQERFTAYGWDSRQILAGLHHETIAVILFILAIIFLFMRLEKR